MWCNISLCICLRKIVKLLHVEIFVFWQDIPEAPERQMTDKINEVIMLCRFPAEIKSFYMQKDKVDTRVTESVSSHFPYSPRVGPECVLCPRIDPLRFLAGCRRRRLNQGLVVALGFSR